MKLARFLAQGLEEEGYAVDLSHEGMEGMALAGSGACDVIVLDVMFPGRSGFRVLTELRRGTTGRQDVLRYADLELDRLAHAARLGGR